MKKRLQNAMAIVITLAVLLVSVLPAAMLLASADSVNLISGRYAVSVGMASTSDLSVQKALTDANGSPEFNRRLTDGVDTEGFDKADSQPQRVQMWGAVGISGAKFVVKYDLGEPCNLASAAAFGIKDAAAAPVWDFYASASEAELYQAASKAGAAAAPVAGKTYGSERTLSLSSVRYVAFVISPTDASRGMAVLSELEIKGAPADGERDSYTPPAKVTRPNLPEPATPNLLVNYGAGDSELKPVPIIAQYGWFNYAVDKTNYSSPTAAQLLLVTDGKGAVPSSSSIQYYGNMSTGRDNPGIRYDLGGFYDISRIRAYTFGSTNPAVAVTGLRIFAAEELADLYKDSSMVYCAEDMTDLTGKVDVEITPVKARHVAFFLTQSVSGYRMTEFELYGSESVTAPENVLAGVKADVTLTTGEGFQNRKALSAVNGSAEYNRQLTDGISVFANNHPQVNQIWGAKGASGKFVLIYDLRRKCDLTRAVYTGLKRVEGADYSYQAIPAWSVYAGDGLQTLFDSGNHYENPAASADPELASYVQELDLSGVQARYVAFVIPQSDAQNGLVKLSELAVFGLTSAGETDPGPETVTPETPEYTEPEGPSRIAGLTGQGVRAPLNLFSGALELTFGSQSLPEHALSKLTDGNTAQSGSIMMYGGMRDPGDFPGVVYDMGANYDISHIAIHTFAGDTYGVTGVRVFAAETYTGYGDLCKDSNLVMLSEDRTDTSGVHKLMLESGEEVTARYVAIFLTQTRGGWRAAEFEVFGAFSATQPEKDPPAGINIIGGKGFKTAGVASTDNYIQLSGAGGTPDHAVQLTDGVVETEGVMQGIQLWGGDPAKNGGKFVITYDLGGRHNLNGAIVHSTKAGAPYAITAWDIYASDSLATLFDAANRHVGKAPEDEPGSKQQVDFTQENVRYVAFVFSQEDAQYGALRLAELAVYGFVADIVPVGGSIIAGKEGQAVRVGGDYSGYQKTTFSSQKIPIIEGGVTVGYDEETHSFKKLTDGNITAHIDIWAAEGDKPGVLYTLDEYYDIKQVRAYVFNLSQYAMTGLRVFASDKLTGLGGESTLVFASENPGNLTGIIQGELDAPVRAKYILIMFTQTVSGWRPKELQVFGTKSADQTDPKEPEPRENILGGKVPYLYGVDLSEDLSDTNFAGGSSEDVLDRFTDGIFEEEVNGAVRSQNNQLWGGKDKENARFVLIYDLGENYDISGVKVFGTPDYLDDRYPADAVPPGQTNYKVHQGIESWNVYISRYKDGLISDDNKYTGKTGYSDPDAMEIETDAKMGRYICFVFTIDDLRYGALRLIELEVYGKLSAEQDKEPDPVVNPEYIIVKDSATGIMIYIYALNSDDAVNFTGRLSVTRKTDKESKDQLFAAVDYRYLVGDIYALALLDAAGEAYDLEGRMIRVLMPAPAALKGKTALLAVLDGDEAELMNTVEVDGYYSFDAYRLLSYAFLTEGEGGNVPTGDSRTAFLFGAACIIAAGTLLVLASKKKSHAQG